MTFRRLLGAASALALLCAYGGALAQDDVAPPGLARDLLDAAAATGDPDEVRAVQRAAARVLPGFRAVIDAYAASKLNALAAEAETSAPADALASGEEPPAKADDSPALIAATPDAAAPRPGLFALRPWKGDFTASAVNATGNSENLAIGLALDAKRKAGPFTHNLTGYFDIGAASDVVNQRRWGGAYKLDFELNERAFVYGRVAYDEDEFSGFDYRLFAGLGAGYFIAESEPFTWKVEGGPGFRYSPIDDTREVDENIALFASTDIDWVIREGLTFEQDAAATYTDPTSTFESTTALKVDLFGDLTTGLSFYYRYETNPPPGRVNADTVVRATLGYDF